MADEINIDDEQAKTEHLMIDRGLANTGLFKSRIDHNHREFHFHRTWIEENEKKSYLGSGQGILQNLFIQETHLCSSFYIHKITNIERCIVATIIQWLGTNVGFCFLEKCLNRAGYRVIPKD